MKLIKIIRIQSDVCRHLIRNCLKYTVLVCLKLWVWACGLFYHTATDPSFSTLLLLDMYTDLIYCFAVCWTPVVTFWVLLCYELFSVWCSTLVYFIVLVNFTVLVFHCGALSDAPFVFLFGVPFWCTGWCTVWCGSFPAVTSPGSNWADCGHNSAPPLLTIIRRSTLRYRYREGRGGRTMVMLGNCANEDDEGYVLMLMLMTLMLMMLISIPEVVVPAIDPPLALKAGRLVLKFCPALAALKVKDEYWITYFCTRSTESF